jgi:aldose 1-epimerase
MTRLREHVLRDDELEVVILPEVGARLHRIRAYGEDLLRTPRDPGLHVTEPFFWGAYVMAPWCNRAAAGKLGLADRAVDLAANFPDGTAIHGLVASAPWRLDADGALSYSSDARRDWPWAFEVTQTASLAGATLLLEYRLVNLDPHAPMPAGLGLHPWFRRPVALRIPAERVYASNSESSPTPTDVEGALDLQALSEPSDDLDGTWADLTEPSVELTWPRSALQATIAIATDGARPLIAVATPATIDAIAVEPQTHGPDPFRRLASGEPDPPALLAPGASLRLAVRLSIERRSPAVVSLGG